VIVLEIVAWVFLAAMLGVAAGVLFQAVVKIWEHTRTLRVPSYRGREVVRSEPSLPRCGEVILGEWYANDLITPTELELFGGVRDLEGEDAAADCGAGSGGAMGKLRG
jgi:hypothetical protein